MYVGLDDSGKGWIQQMRNDGATAYDLSLQPVGGNVGIGTTGPTSLLSIYNSTATASFDITSAGQTDKRFTFRSNYQGSGTSERLSVLNGTGTELFTIASSGNVGIGSTSPSGKLDIVGDLTGSTGALFRVASVSELFRIQETGNVGIGTTGPATKLDVWGTAGANDIFNVASSSGTSVLRITKSGNVGIGTTNPSTNTLQVTGSAGKTVGGTSWQDLSDARLKNVLGELNGSSLDKLMQLRPIKYEWNDLHKQLYGNGADTVMYGFVAQELKEVIPEFVKEGGDGYLWYNPSGIEAILTAGVQEQQGEIASLSLGLEELEAKVASLSAEWESAQRDGNVGTGTYNISAILSGILDLLESAYKLTIEEGLIKTAKGVFDDLTAGKATVQELCVDDICVTSQDLKALLEKTGVRTFMPTPEPAPVEAEEDPLTESPEPITASSSEEDTLESPSQTPEVSPEATPGTGTETQQDGNIGIGTTTPESTPEQPISE